jgi:hypothetical protein
MAINLEQLQDRRDARNPAQWDWRVIHTEYSLAGNCPILNLKFSRVIKPARQHRGVRSLLRKARVLQMRAVGRKKYVGRTKFLSLRGLS